MQYRSINNNDLKLKYDLERNGVTVDGAEPHSSVGSVADLRTGDRWFNPWLGTLSF